jgi:hypothetical protein
MFVSPGFPEPLPAVITAVGDPAEAPPTRARRKTADDRKEISFFFKRIHLK